MSSNMLDLLKNIDGNKGIIINSLIKAKVFTSSDIVNAAIDSNLPYVIYYVALYIKGLSKKSVDRLADYIIGYGNMKYIHDFAKNVRRAPIDKLADTTIKFGTPENIFDFAKNVEGAPINRLAEAIIQRKNSEYIYKFATEINGVHINLLADALIELKESWYLCHIANNINDKILKRKIFDKVLYEIKSAKDIYKCAKFMDGLEIEEIENALIAIDNAEYIYKFACDIEGAHIDILADSIIKLGDAEYIYHFARMVKGAPMDKLATAIIDTKDITYIDLFMHIEGAPVEKMMLTKNRMIVSSMTEEEKLDYVINLALNSDVKTIGYSSDMYRSLFIDETTEQTYSKQKRRILRNETK